MSSVPRITAWADQAYVDWLGRSIIFPGKRHPPKLAPGVEAALRTQADIAMSAR